LDKQLTKTFYNNGNEELAKKMSVYMKDKFHYLGIQKPLRAVLQNEFIKQAKQQKR